MPRWHLPVRISVLKRVDVTLIVFFREEIRRLRKIDGPSSDQKLFAQMSEILRAPKQREKAIIEAFQLFHDEAGAAISKEFNTDLWKVLIKHVDFS